MGQYYKVYVSNDEGHKAFCPQEAVYMTKNGIEDSTKIENRSWDERDPNSWYSNFSELKLMEHSWLKNDFVNGVLETTWDARDSRGTIDGDAHLVRALGLRLQLGGRFLRFLLTQ